ncbi:MAG: hypothetical protein HDR25_03035 [Lachnospiraceae bacterium]|nr:hypothetical protein [Lachnospiraceae bacterium]
MMVKVQGREIAFIATYDETVKGTIEKAFLRNGVSYLIKMEKIKRYEKGRFATKIKYLFRINRFQEDEARAALSEKELSEESVTYLA